MKIFEEICGCVAPGKSLESLQNFSCIKFVWRKAFETIRDKIESGDIIGTNDGTWEQQQCREKIVEFIEQELNS